MRKRIVSLSAAKVSHIASVRLPAAFNVAYAQPERRVASAMGTGGGARRPSASPDAFLARLRRTTSLASASASTATGVPATTAAAEFLGKQAIPMMSGEADNEKIIAAGQVVAPPALASSSSSSSAGSPRISLVEELLEDDDVDEDEAAAAEEGSITRRNRSASLSNSASDDGRNVYNHASKTRIAFVSTAVAEPTLAPESIEREAAFYGSAATADGEPPLSLDTANPDVGRANGVADFEEEEHDDDDEEDMFMDDILLSTADKTGDGDGDGGGGGGVDSRGAGTLGRTGSATRAEDFEAREGENATPTLSTAFEGAAAQAALEEALAAAALLEEEEAAAAAASCAPTAHTTAAHSGSATTSPSASSSQGTVDGMSFFDASADDISAASVSMAADRRGRQRTSAEGPAATTAGGVGPVFDDDMAASAERESVGDELKSRKR